jgi:2-hydroxychromene-2-carboxylate isomerase
VQDVSRLAREAGLKLTFPAVDDVDWSLPHAAFLAAEERNAGHPFMLETFRKRWTEGRDLGDEGVLAEAAAAAGLDAAALLEAARSEALQAEAEAGFRRGIERDKIFGVPSFVYRGKLYWGQDRMHFVRSAVLRKSGGGSGREEPES